ncbi:MAG: HD domain-containing protein [candidate division Zixibacteria bacterium]|nr:HD domain-containing protein [candidate division Zixibacteria bacterium]
MNDSDLNPMSIIEGKELQLKGVIEQTLKNSLDISRQQSDSHKRIAETADEILQALKSFCQNIKAGSDPGSESKKTDERTTTDFDRLARQVLADVQFGYLSSNLQMLMALGSAVAERDTGNSEHNYRVTLYGCRLAEEIGLKREQIQTFIKGSFLHDIGKIGICDDILLKPDKLTDKETAIMHNHVLMGSRIIKDVRWLEDAHEIVLFHHERFNGEGYLSGLRGENIPIYDRIFAIVDVFDALTSDRPYKPAYTYDETLDYMENQRSRHFDPEILDRFALISHELYNDIARKTMPDLPDLIHHMIKRHFNIDLDDDSLQTRYSIM